jgi:hypothetical protein
LVELPDEGLRAESTERLLDACGELASSVILAAAAVEAYANEAIERLSDGFELRIIRDDEEVVIPRSQLARRLTITEKLDRIVPQVAQRRSIKGLAVWGDFKRLKNLRDDLIHLKMRGYPDEPSALARLAIGQAAGTVKIAVRVIETAEPGWIQAAL